MKVQVCSTQQSTSRTTCSATSATSIKVNLGTISGGAGTIGTARLAGIGCDKAFGNGSKSFGKKSFGNKSFGNKSFSAKSLESSSRAEASISFRGTGLVLGLGLAELGLDAELGSGLHVVVVVSSTGSYSRTLFYFLYNNRFKLLVKLVNPYHRKLAI